MDQPPNGTGEVCPPAAQSETTGASEKPSLPQSVPISKFLENPAKPPEPIVDGLITPGITLIVGAPGGGKTHVSSELTRAVGGGEPAFGRFATKKGPVLFVEEEHHEGDLAERFVRAGMRNADVHVLHAKGLRLDDAGWVRHLAEELARTNAILCVLDPFADLHEQDESDNHAMQNVTKRLRVLKKERPNVAFVVIHHPTKGAWKDGVDPEMGDGRGAGRIVGMADAVYTLACKKRTPELLKLSLKCRKRRDGPAHAPLLLTVRFGAERTEWSVEADSKAGCNDDSDAEVRSRFIEALKEKGPFRNKQAAKASVTGNAGTKTRVLNELILDGTVRFDDVVGGFILAERSPPRG